MESRLPNNTPKTAKEAISKHLKTKLQFSRKILQDS